MINNMIKDNEILASSDPPPPDFGVDPDGPAPDEEFGTVEMPVTACMLNEDDLQHFIDAVDTESFFEDMGIQHFIFCKTLLESLLE